MSVAVLAQVCNICVQVPDEHRYLVHGLGVVLASVDHLPVSRVQVVLHHLVVVVGVLEQVGPFEFASQFFRLEVDVMHLLGASLGGLA